MGINKETRDKKLKAELDRQGFLFMSENKKLSKDFIESNADLINDDEIWISLIRNQKHIDSEFYYKFSSDFNLRIHVILLRKAVSDILKKISL